MRIAKIGVVGAGSMGSGIAALAASAGLPVVLLDIPGESDRNGVVDAGLARAIKAKPAPFMDPARAALIQTGNTEDHLDLLRDCDWIVEAIIEQPAPKRDLFLRIDALRKHDAIVSSNTSSIPMEQLVDGRTPEFRAHFIGAHFFNPPRYLHLLELIPTADTTDVVMNRLRRFAERTLGKGVVVAKDAPGFIANRLGIHGLVRTLRLMEQYELSVDEVDALTGTLIGRPKSATFRTGDITGIDVLAHVSVSLGESTGEDFSLPDWVHRLLAAGHKGEKSGAGFYRREGKAILTVNPDTLEYAPKTTPDLRELDSLIRAPLNERLPALMRAGGRYAEFVRDVLLDMAHYTIEKTPVIAHDVSSVDRAMEWGYAWEIGPFQQIDAITVDVLRDAFTARKLPHPPLLQSVHEAFYRELSSGPRQITLSNGYVPVESMRDAVELPTVRRMGGTIEANDEAALLDIGEDVLLLEFRGKMNTLGPGVFSLLELAASRVNAGPHQALVIGNADPRTFSAGANLMALMGPVQAGDWKEVDARIHHFQQAVMSARRSPFPVVVAPFGLTLGGGTELMMHADHVQAHAELYAGLVEVGVGLLPGGGGTKELLFRFAAELAAYEEADPFEAVKRAFKTISMGVTSTSALHAQSLGFVRRCDAISMNRDRLLSDARARAVLLARDYTPVPPMTIRSVGTDGLGNLSYAVWSMQEAGYISAHDARIGTAIATVLCGGDGPARDVSEQDVLDLEREAFMSLLGTAETQARIAHMLKTGKPLRN